MNDIGSEQFQRAPEYHRGCHPVDVVVAVHGDAFAFGNRGEDAFDSDGHVGQRERVEQIVERWREKSPGLGHIRDAADAQQSSGYRRDSQLAGQRLGLRVITVERLPQSLNHSAIPTLPIFRHFW